eukprot:1180818-Prorocentrum_minimum.AAC.3
MRIYPHFLHLIGWVGPGEGGLAAACGAAVNHAAHVSDWSVMGIYPQHFLHLIGWVGPGEGGLAATCGAAGGSEPRRPCAPALPLPPGG